MARDNVGIDPVGDLGSDVLQGWLAAVGAALSGPRRWRADLMDELGDGLLEATERRVQCGQPPAVAAVGTVAEFGDPQVVGTGLAVEGAAELARRVGLRLLASGPLAAASWLTAFAATDVPMWRRQLSGVWWAMPVLGVLLAVVILAAVMTLLPTSRIGARWASRSWSSLAYARIAALGCAGADTLMLSLFGIWAAGRGPETGWILACPAVAFSMGRLVVALRAASACASACDATAPAGAN